MNGTAVLAETLVRRDPAVAARIVETSGPDTVAAALATLGPEALASLFREMSPSNAARCTGALPREAAAGALVRVPFGVAAATLRRLPMGTRREITALLDPKLHAALQRVLVHPADTAGAAMNALVFTASATTPIAAVIEQARGSSTPPSRYVYVTGADQRFEGAVRVGDVLGADPTRALAELAGRDFASVLPNARAHAVIDHPAWLRQDALAVTDTQGTLLGAVEREAVVALRGDRSARASSDELARTAAALAEVYGFGLASVLEWVVGGTRPANSEGAR